MVHKIGERNKNNKCKPLGEGSRWVVGGEVGVDWTWWRANDQGVEAVMLVGRGMTLGIHSMVLKTFLRVSKTVTRP